jgi:Tfp pilus assembly protein PilX
VEHSLLQPKEKTMVAMAVLQLVLLTKRSRAAAAARSKTARMGESGVRDGNGDFNCNHTYFGFYGVSFLAVQGRTGFLYGS